MKNTDFTTLFTKIHENKWVALSADRKKIIAYSAKFSELTKKIGTAKVVYMKVPPMDAVLAFS